MGFYQNYIRQCNKKGVTPSKAAVEAGTTKTSVNRWKNGSLPTDATLAKLATYFECDVEELLLGEEKSARQHEADGLSEKAKEAATLFERAEPWVQDQILSLLRAAESSREVQGGDSKE